MNKKTREVKARPRITLIRLFAVFALILLLVALFGSALGGRMGLFHKLALDSLGPVQSALSRAGRTVQVVKDDYLALWRVREENRRLLKVIDSYQEQLGEYREAYARNRYLESALAFKQSAEFPPLSARVVGKDPSFWFQTLIVDRGRSDGVVAGMVARTPAGVAGQVIQVSENYAKILLANAPSSAIDAVIQKSLVRGILKGSGEQGLQLQYVLKNSDLAVGDQVVTAGVGELFPAGVPLGTVASVRSQSRGMFLEVDVRPAVDFERLEYLFIVAGQQQRMAEELALEGQQGRRP